MTERIRSLQMHDGNRRWWALGAMCFALFMIMLDNTVVNVALPSIQRSLERVDVVAGVDRQRLHAVVRRAARHRRAPRRPVRAAQNLPRRRRHLRLGQRRDRLLAERHVAGRLARRAGHRLGADDARDAVDHHQRLPARGARQGDRHVGRRVGHGAGDRPRRRRLSRRERQLAVDLLPQRARRRRRRRDRAVRRARVARRDRRALGRRSRRAHADARPGRARAGARRGQRMGLGLDAGAVDVRCRRSSA